MYQCPYGKIFSQWRVSHALCSCSFACCCWNFRYNSTGSLLFDMIHHQLVEKSSSFCPLLVISLVEHNISLFGHFTNAFHVMTCLGLRTKDINTTWWIIFVDAKNNACVSVSQQPFFSPAKWAKMPMLLKRETECVTVSHCVTVASVSMISLNTMARAHTLTQIANTDWQHQIPRIYFRLRAFFHHEISMQWQEIFFPCFGFDSFLLNNFYSYFYQRNFIRIRSQSFIIWIETFFVFLMFINSWLL